MKYQVGDLVNYANGNANRVGYITKVDNQFLYIRYFHHNKDYTTEKMAYSYFQLYYKVISKVKE
mgnify:CR=1 FL=1